MLMPLRVHQITTATEGPWATKNKKTATSSVVAIAIRMKVQLLTNRGKHTCVGLAAAQQPIQCKYNSTACDKSAKIAASAWWHAGAFRFKLGERAGVPAYLYKWRTPEAPPQRGGETTKPETRSPSKTTDTTPQGGAGGRIPWGGGGGGCSGPASCMWAFCAKGSNAALHVLQWASVRLPTGGHSAVVRVGLLRGGASQRASGRCRLVL